jgi:hypothetical protein
MVFYDVHQLTNYSIPLSDFENVVGWVEYAKSNILYPLQWLLYWAHTSVQPTYDYTQILLLNSILTLTINAQDHQLPKIDSLQ